jgi:hypothetical protein
MDIEFIDNSNVVGMLRTDKGKAWRDPREDPAFAHALIREWSSLVCWNNNT